MKSTHNRPTFLGLACLALGMLLPLAARAQSQVAEPQRALLANYLLQPSDLLQVKVFQEPDLDREIRISQDFSIMLPLIGSINVQGKSARQLEQEIRELYDKDFLVNPQVNVSVVQYAQRTVSILGAVNSPGPVAFPPEDPLRLIDAIARAGGFNRLANPARVTLTRKLPDGTSKVFTINVAEMMRGRPAPPDVPALLERDDVINVPESIL